MTTPSASSWTPYTLTELEAIAPTAEDWGPWRLDPTTRVLTTDRYEVDLDTCTTPAQVLDWIAQVAGKTWADPTTLAGLVRALDDVLHLQRRLCPFGQPHTITPTAIHELATNAAERWPHLTTNP